MFESSVEMEGQLIEIHIKQNSGKLLPLVTFTEHFFLMQIAIFLPVVFHS